MKIFNKLKELLKKLKELLKKWNPCDKIKTRLLLLSIFIISFIIFFILFYLFVNSPLNIYNFGNPGASDESLRIFATWSAMIHIFVFFYSIDNIEKECSNDKIKPSIKYYIHILLISMIIWLVFAIALHTPWKYRRQRIGATF